ncbi:MAG: serine/threonine protein kinase [Actinomycetales bacterium]|nr:serine/threonine protein kinase [Actinomycetales bacterium]
MTARMPSAPPSIPGYRYVEPLGTGGFADVFLYEQIGLGARKVGVKVLLQGLRADLQQAFEAEASVMARLSNHPHIVSIFDAAVTTDGRAYLVMEYCPPPHLATMVKAKPLSMPKALEVMIQVSGAVETAHLAGILHRDIKPANILFTEFHRPALTDFGISASTQQGQAGKAVGVSIPWAPPEQLTSERPMGPTGDVYSLAATLYHVLAGHAPFWIPGGANDNSAMGQRILNEPLPRLRRDDIPAALQRVLAVAMSKRPEQRYPTALEFARALQQVQLDEHLPQTSAGEQAGLLSDHDRADDEDAGGTVVAGIVNIDPQASGLTGGTDLITGQGTTGGTREMPHTGSVGISGAGVLHHGRGSAPVSGPVEFTGPAIPGLIEGDTLLAPGGSAHVDSTDGSGSGGGARLPVSPRRRSSVMTWSIASGVVLLLAAGAFLLSRAGTPGSTANPVSSTSVSAKPIDAVGQSVPDVTAVSLTPNGSSVTVTWTNPSPQSGDTYLYRIVDPANPKDYSLANQTMATVPTVPGRTCVEVVLRRASGRASNPIANCAVTP